MSKKVLIVDDEPDIAAYLAAILNTNGFTATVADSVQSGLEAVDRITPDLICLDIMMPKESGISMYRRLRETDATRHIPVVIISGAEQQGKFNFRSYLPEESIPEPDCYLEKPIDVKNFVEIVERLIGSGLSSGGNQRR